MAGESGGDALFYDFLIDEPEMPTPMPMPMPTQAPANLAAAASTGPPQPQAIAQTANDFDPVNIASARPPDLAHLQQPISAPNRTSPQRHLPTPSDPLNPALLPGASVASVASVASAAPDPTRPVTVNPRDRSRPLPQSHHGILDLHGHHPQSLAPTAAAAFQPHISQVVTTSTAPMSMDWGMYGVAQPPMSLHTSPFDFELPGTMMPSMPHHGHISPGMPDHSLAYGTSVVSPSSIHSSQNHYGFSGSWEDHMAHDGNTPTVSTPAQMSTNPWTDPEELQRELDSVHGSRPKKTPRSRRAKRDSRNSADNRTGPSPDAASPSSASQNSRGSIGSKSASITSSSIASSSVASVSTASSRQSKLRSASRTSKNSHNKPSDTPEERRTRASHNLVEKQYRNRLNAQFESLLSALPEQIRASGEGEENSDGGGGGGADWGDRRVSKGEVLEMARRHIKSLEQERDMLERENTELQGNLAQLKKSVGGDEDAGHESPLNFNISMDDDKDEDPS